MGLGAGIVVVDQKRDQVGIRQHLAHDREALAPKRAAEEADARRGATRMIEARDKPRAGSSATMKMTGIVPAAAFAAAAEGSPPATRTEAGSCASSAAK